MRAVTFLTKKQVRLCYPQLRFAAVLYAAVPVAVFLLGWLKLYWGIPAAALLAAGVLGLRPGRKEPSAAAAEKAACVPVWALAVVLVFALAWCLLGGQGGYFYQNSDFANRNGVLHDLVNYPWPVYYQSGSGGFGNHGNPFALVYYICHWLLPALAGKLVLAVTGAAGAAWLAANFALFVWTGLGVFLVFCLLAVTLRPQSWVALLAVCVGFMAFSGLDIVGTVWMHQDVGFHIERWAGVNEYSSMTTCLFWVFNQTVVPWLMTLCVLNEKRVEHYALLGLLALPFGPLPFVGLAVMCLGLGAVRLVQSAQAPCPHSGARCSRARTCLCWRPFFRCSSFIFPPMRPPPCRKGAFAFTFPARKISRQAKSCSSWCAFICWSAAFTWPLSGAIIKRRRCSTSPRPA